jgi:tripartite-type tricarboxylate transporter receptor subunit TctC
MGKFATSSLFTAGVLIAAGLFASSAALAQGDYPSRRIVCIVPTEAGSDGDIMARKILEKVAARLGQPILVTNKPGAAGAPGYRELHGAKPDGYTIGLAFPTLYTNKMSGLMPWDHNDFTLIAQHGTFTPVVLTSAKSSHSLKTVQDIVTVGKQKPGELKFALSVVGGSVWAAAMVFQSAVKVQFKNIPQEGSGAFVITQLAGGHTDVGVSNLATALSQVDAGNINFVATFGRKRWPGKFSNVPTLADAGFDATWDSPNYFIAPRNTPAAIVEKLSKAIEAEVNSPEFQKAALEIHATPEFRAAGELKSYLDAQQKTSREIMRNAGILKE